MDKGLNVRELDRHLNKSVFKVLLCRDLIHF